MKNYTILFMMLAVCCVQCQSEVDGPVSQGYELELTRSDTLYDDLMSAIQKGAVISDPFKLKNVYIKDLKLHVEVSYGGGCEKHRFEIVWPDAIIMIYPPQFSVILNHNSNGDACEAWLTETIVIDLKDSPLGFSDDAINSMHITVINGSNADETVSN
ncbi:MAG: hypothetical protein OEX02_08220 [Cyclobacteriaceae bacterium]|nr:hypothetical protein [Cyclobacteriaceae bacterium]